MVEYLDKFAQEGTEFETKALFTLYSVDVVASTGFGFEANAFTDPESVFRDYVSYKPHSFSLFNYTCQCKEGFSLSPLGLCEDVDECSRISSCSQLCTNTKGSFKCGCEEGYEVEGRQCRALGVKNQLFLYAVGNHIKGLLAGLGGQQVCNCI